MLRWRSWYAGEHAESTEVLINIQPVDPLPCPDNFKVLTLRWRRIG